MVDTVVTQILRNDGYKYIVRLLNDSDGTGESAVSKIDVSGLVAKHGYTIRGVDIDLISGQVGGFNNVRLAWDATADDEIANLFPGSFYLDFLRDSGPLVDPRSAGSTGDVLLTTDGGAAGSGYDITIHCTVRYLG